VKICTGTHTLHTTNKAESEKTMPPLTSSHWSATHTQGTLNTNLKNNYPGFVEG